MKHGGSWRKGIVVLCVCATAVVASATLRNPPAPIQSQPPATNTGVAIIKLKSLFDTVVEFNEGMALIEEKKKDSQAKLKEVETQLKKLSADFDALKDPPMAVRLDQQAKIVELQALGDARAAALTRSLEVQAGDLMRRVFLKAVETAERLAEKDGWDVILIDDRNIVPPERAKGDGAKEGRRITVGEVESIIQQRQILVANDKRIDVTPSLVAMMNNEYKAGKK